MRKINLIAMLAMTVVSFASVFGVSIAGVSVMIGITFFIIYRKNASTGNELDAKTIGKHLKNKKIYFWIVLPVILNAVCIVMAELFLPQYIEHLYERTAFVGSFNQIIVLLIQLAFIALGEEIAWRAFFQNQLSKALPIIPSLLITSIIFAFGHIVEGNIIVVTYDIFFIFINSLVYGWIFYKTNNTWLSVISHFSANLFCIILISFLL